MRERERHRRKEEGCDIPNRSPCRRRRRRRREGDLRLVLENGRGQIGRMGGVHA